MPSTYIETVNGDDSETGLGSSGNLQVNSGADVGDIGQPVSPKVIQNIKKVNTCRCTRIMSLNIVCEYLINIKICKPVF